MRNDIHSPKNYLPENYDYAGLFIVNSADEHDRQVINRFLNSTRPAAPRYGLGKCEHCGAQFTYGALYRHVPTGEIIQIGNVCADKAFGFSSRREADLARAKARAAAARINAARKVAVGEWLLAHPEAAETLAQFGTYHPILSDMIEKLKRWGNLSENQAVFILKLRAQIVSEALTNDADKVEAKPAPNGKVSVADVRLVSCRCEETMYGTVFKGLFVGDGWKAWGTVPQALLSLGRDEWSKPSFSFTLSATFTPKADDPSFAFIKRPAVKF